MEGRVEGRFVCAEYTGRDATFTLPGTVVAGNEHAQDLIVGELVVNAEAVVVTVGVEYIVIGGFPVGITEVDIGFVIHVGMFMAIAIVTIDVQFVLAVIEGSATIVGAIDALYVAPVQRDVNALFLYLFSDDVNNSTSLCFEIGRWVGEHFYLSDGRGRQALQVIDKVVAGEVEWFAIHVYFYAFAVGGDGVVCIDSNAGSFCEGFPGGTSAGNDAVFHIEDYPVCLAFDDWFGRRDGDALQLFMIGL